MNLVSEQAELPAVRSKHGPVGSGSEERVLLQRPSFSLLPSSQQFFVEMLSLDSFVML